MENQENTVFEKLTTFDHVYDNFIAKPPPIDGRGRFSVAVIFKSGSGYHWGQYNYEETEWSTIPSDEKMRKFYDKEVFFWCYSPCMKEKEFKNGNTKMRAKIYTSEDETTGFKHTKEYVKAK